MRKDFRLQKEWWFTVIMAPTKSTTMDINVPLVDGSEKVPRSRCLVWPIHKRNGCHRIQQTYIFIYNGIIFPTFNLKSWKCILYRPTMLKHYHSRTHLGDGIVTFKSVLSQEMCCSYQLHTGKGASMTKIQKNWCTVIVAAKLCSYPGE